MAGAPVFLGVTLSLETETWGLLWRDANCQFINPRYVELQNNMTRMQARCLAVENYDANEADRIINWNKKVGVNAARRRIVRWTAAGSQPEMIIHRDDLLGPDDIKSLVLASDYIEQERRGLEELSRMLLDRRNDLSF